MKWQMLKEHALNLCLYEVIEGNKVTLSWERKESPIISNGKPRFNFDGPKNYKHLVKEGFQMLESMNQGHMNAQKLTIELTEANDTYLIGKGTPFLESAEILTADGNTGRVDLYAQSMLAENFGFIKLNPVALPLSFSRSLNDDDFETCHSILDKMCSMPSLFGEFGQPPKYQIRLTIDNGENLSWDTTTLLAEPLQIITT